MSNVVFPSLASIAWPFVKSLQFNTKTQTAVSLKEYRAAFAQYPLYTFTLYYEVLRDAASPAELQQLMGFYGARQGQFDNFLFTDPTDNTVTAQNFGTGTGAATVFPLVRTLGSGGFTFNDLVQNVNTITGIYDNGSPVSQGAGAGKYTIDAYGNVTFGTAPTTGHALTWTGTFYYRCRFLTDQQDFNKMMAGLWDLNGTNGSGYLQIAGSPMNKV